MICDIFVIHHQVRYKIRTFKRIIGAKII